MRDKRVVFDFALQFSNGGGLQGQGFRLDIDGETIADEKLVAYLIQDPVTKAMMVRVAIRPAMRSTVTS